MHKNIRHIKAKEERRKYSPTQPTLKVFWDKQLHITKKGVEHVHYVPRLIKA